MRRLYLHGTLLPGQVIQIAGVLYDLVRLVQYFLKHKIFEFRLAVMCLIRIKFNFHV